MLDLLGVLFSTIAVLLVAWRAAKLDQLYPWFDHVSDSEEGVETGDDGRRPADVYGRQKQPR
jgi:hypothetical protein